MTWIIVILAVVLGLALAIGLAYLLANRERHALNDTVRAKLGGNYVRLSTGVTHYELAGPAEGPIVCLIHGLTIPIWTWDPHIDALHAAGLRTLRYDMYGRGYSDRPRVRYDRALFVTQLKELLDTLGITQPVDIVGSSLGSGIGITFAAQNPSRVRRVVCLSPLVNSGKVPIAMFRPPVVGEVLMRFVGMPFYTKRALHFYRAHPERERYTAKYLEQISYRGFEYSGLSEIRSDISGDYRDAYRTVGANGHPALLIYGSEDHEFTRESVDEACALLNHCAFHEIPAVGHGIELHLHPKVNELLVSFLTAAGDSAKDYVVGCFRG
jgi:pimeloyl-ACP methyl ester carboxylesterase